MAALLQDRVEAEGVALVGRDDPLAVEEVTRAVSGKVERARIGRRRRGLRGSGCAPDQEQASGEPERGLPHGAGLSRRRISAAGAKTTLRSVPRPAVIPRAANAGFALIPRSPKERTVESIATMRLTRVAPSSSGWSRLSTTKMA